MSNPVPQTDAVFLKHFAQVITGLVLVALGLIALSTCVHNGTKKPVAMGKASVVEARLAPVGGVHAGDTGRAAIAAAEEARRQAAASQVAYGGTTDGSVIYNNLCSACHNSGAGGSPRLTDTSHWNQRIALGLDTLVQHATDGFTGSLGMMPARGGNASLNDEQVKATVEWMIAQVK